MANGEELNRLRQEVVSLRAALANHPAADALRFVAPFLRDAMEAGVWKAGLGTESVEHEIRAALAWLNRFEAVEVAGNAR